MAQKVGGKKIINFLKTLIECASKQYIIKKFKKKKTPIGRSLFKSIGEDKFNRAYPKKRRGLIFGGGGTRMMRCIVLTFKLFFAKL